MYVAPERVLRTTMGFNLHRGIVASAHRTPLPEPESLLASATGWRCSSDSTTTRTSARCSATRAPSASTRSLLDPQTADPLYRRCVRVSMGHVLRMPVRALHRVAGRHRHVAAPRLHRHRAHAVARRSADRRDRGVSTGEDCDRPRCRRARPDQRDPRPGDVCVRIPMAAGRLAERRHCSRDRVPPPRRGRLAAARRHLHAGRH